MAPEEMPRDGTPPGGAGAPFSGSFWATSPGTESKSGFGSGSGPQLPLNIGHRGYKAAFPENSMAAFHGAVAAGAHAIETDLHLSRDGVVVLSHDASLKRCFGVDAKVADCDWSYLRTLETLAEPRQGMPQLSDVLEWLTQPGLESIWMVLDIKTDDDPDQLMPAIARTLASVPPAPHGRAWTERVVVGAWNEHYLARTRHHLPHHPLLLITFSLLYAHKFLSSSDPSKNADVHFSLFQPALVGPLGARFRRLARERGRRVFAWTVNDEAWMEWCVRKGVAGVITDEVGRFEGVRRGFEGGEYGDGTAGDSSGGDGDVDVDGKGVVVMVRNGTGTGWPRWVRLYAKAGLLQAVAMLASVLLWRRLSSRGGGTKKGTAVEGAVPDEV